MQIHEDEPYLEIEEVADACQIKESLIRQGVQRIANHWQGIKLPDQDQRRTFIRFNTMKEEYKTAVCQKYFNGYDPITWQKMKAMQGDILSSWDYKLTLEETLDEACESKYKQYERYFKNIKTEDAHLRSQQIKCLARASVLLDELVKWYEEHDMRWKDSSGYEKASAWLTENLRVYFPLKYIPTHPRRLREKVDLMVKEDLRGYQVIALPRAGNDNRGKYDETTKKEILGLVIRQMISGHGWSNQQIIRMVQRRYSVWEEIIPSDATIRRLMDMPRTKTIVASARYEDNAKKKQKYRFSTPLARAMFANDCWEMDGTKVQWEGFYSDGVKYSLYIVVCRDVYSGAYLGWSYGLHENSEMYWEALKMAVDIAGGLPYELKVDKFSKTKELDNLFEKMEGLGMKYTVGVKSTTKPYAERGFKTLQEVFESEEQMWIGEGILSGDENSRPTVAYLNMVRKDLKNADWDWDKAWTSHNQLMMRYNATPLSAYSKKHKKLDISPIALFRTCEKPNLISVEIWDKASLFWAEAVREHKNYQIIIEKRDKGKIVFDMNDKKYMEVLTNYPEVKIRYDNDLLDEVLLFCPKTDTYLATIQAFNPIQLHGPNAEYSRNTAYQTKRKEIQTEVKRMRNEALDGSVREVNESDLRLGATSTKAETTSAEDLAIEQYRYKAPPTSNRVLTTGKKRKSDKEQSIATPKHTEVDTVEECLEAISMKARMVSSW